MPRIRLVSPAVIVVALALAGCAGGSTSSSTPTSPPPAAATWPPSSIVVLGHSGATGFNSDPDRPQQDAVENSWATGTNPDVDSIYLRFLAENADLEGHNFNVARSGSDVGDLPRQVSAALELDPLPDLFIVQTVDNDIQCDGSDADNTPVYGDNLDAVLASINLGAPDARIFIVGVWATVQNYTDVTSQIPQAVSENQGGGVCAVFDEAGNEIPEVMANFAEIIDGYQAEVRDSCAAAHACTFGGEEILNMVIEADDLAPDTYHLSVIGLHKMADTAWEVIGG